MTQEGDKPILVRKLVLVFDICSSTSMLEDLKATDNLARWRNLLIALKGFLLQKSKPRFFELYKFIGDGWILLFPADTTNNHLLDFICELRGEFYGQLAEHVEPFLQHQHAILGITVGVDSGDLIQLEMNEETEYLGRALNVASRLQAATKELDGGASDKALFSRNSFNSMNGELRGEFKLTEASVALRNISGGQKCQCLQWEILW